MPKIHLLPVLTFIKYLIGFALLLMFINFNSRIADQTKGTNELALSTNKVVKGQDDILKAIRQVTEDTRITADQQTAIIICMLQVPIENRTTNLQASCRRQYVAPVRTTPDTTEKSVSPSSVNNTPVEQTPQRDTPQVSKPSFIERTTKPVSNLLERIF